MAEAGFGDLVKAVVDYFLGDNRFGSTGSSWRSYFHACGLAAATKKESAC
jgi:hypothetical protein